MSSFDIEDGFAAARASRAPSGHVVTKVRSKRKPPLDDDTAADDIFFRKAVYLQTWGCAHNTSDTEQMAGLLQEAGYTLTENKDTAHVWVLNSCTVKTPAETQVDNAVSKGHSLGKAVVVAGCVSQAAPNSTFLKGVSIIGVQQIDQIVYVVEESLKGNSVRLLSQRREAPLSLELPKVRRNKYIEIIPINSGCLNNCTYCKTKSARGNLRSFTLAAIVARARVAFSEGCKEIWLTSEDLGAWGRDIDMVLPDLLRELVKVIPEGCQMRLGMTNPPYILDYLSDIAEILNHPRVYAFLHVPVQAGSDAVLSDMRREYTSGQFCHLMDYMLEHVPGIYIATDFICAFPTETKEDFDESMALVEKYRFPALFINQFYPRPGTPAARLKKIDTVEARRRTAAMTRAFHAYKRYTPDRIGEVHDVLITEMAKDGINYVGHNKSYEHILVPPTAVPDELLGERRKVRILDVAKFHMTSVIVNEVQQHASAASINQWLYTLSLKDGLAPPLVFVSLVLVPALYILLAWLRDL